MSLVDHLLETRSPLELAKLLAATAKENALLRDRVGALEHELFWMRAGPAYVITYEWTGWRWNGEDEVGVAVTNLDGVVFSEAEAKAFCEGRHAYDYTEVKILKEAP